MILLFSSRKIIPPFIFHQESRSLSQRTRLVLPALMKYTVKATEGRFIGKSRQRKQRDQGKSDHSSGRGYKALCTAAQALQVLLVQRRNGKTLPVRHAQSLTNPHPLLLCLAERAFTPWGNKPPHRSKPIEVTYSSLKCPSHAEH